MAKKTMISHSTLWIGFLLTTTIMAPTIARTLKNQNRICVMNNVRCTILDLRFLNFGYTLQLVTHFIFTLSHQHIITFPLAFAYSSGSVIGSGINNSSFP